MVGWSAQRGGVTVFEVVGAGGVPPLTPAKARARAARVQKARVAASDVRAANAVRLATANRKINRAAETT